MRPILAFSLALALSILSAAIAPALDIAAEVTEAAGARGVSESFAAVSDLLETTASATVDLGSPFCETSSWTVSPSPGSPSWHGSSLSGGIVPGGGALDFFPSPAPYPAATHPVCAIASGTVVAVCDAGTGHGYVIIDHGPGVGKVGYVHMDTATMVRSGGVERGQKIGDLYRAPMQFSDACGSGWSGYTSATHLHLAFERPADMVLGDVRFTTDRHSRDGEEIEFRGPDESGDGDGTSDIGLRRGVTYYLNENEDGDAETYFSVGRTTDEVLIGDWDGTGDDNIGLRRGNTFMLDTDDDKHMDIVFDWGRATDEVLIGDWDG